MKKENKDEVKGKLNFITELCNMLGGDEDSPKLFKVMKADNDFFILKSKILKAEVLDDNDELMNKLIEMYQGDIIYLNHLIEQYNIK